MFCEVDDEFCSDQFNLTGLEHRITYFDRALDMVLDVESNVPVSEAQQEQIENDAEMLYGLIHARFIVTTRGLQAMVCSNTRTHTHSLTSHHLFSYI